MSLDEASASEERDTGLAVLPPYSPKPPPTPESPATSSPQPQDISASSQAQSLSLFPIPSPILHITETIVTTKTTTIYSPKPSNSPLHPLSSPRSPSSFSAKSYTPPQTTTDPGRSPETPERELRRPRLDKELPLLPVDDGMDPPPRTSTSSVSVAFPDVASVPTSSPVALLARAALRLGAPASGISFDASPAQSPVLPRSETPASSTFTITSSPTSRDSPRLDVCALSIPFQLFTRPDFSKEYDIPIPSNADETMRSRSTSITSTARSRKVTFEQEPRRSVPDILHPEYPLPRPRNNARVLSHSRSMYDDRSLRSNLSSEADEASRVAAKVPSETTIPVTGPTFWKSPLRTVRSIRRPRTSDGVARNFTGPTDQLRPNITSQLPSSPIPRSSFPPTVPTLITPNDPLPESRPSDMAPTPQLRRTTSTPRLLAVGDNKAARRRSMSLFHRGKQPAEMSTDGIRPSQTSIPAEDPRQKPPALLRKLSQSLLPPSTRSQSLPQRPLAQPTHKGDVNKQQADAVRNISAEFATNGKGPDAYVRKMLRTVNPSEVAGILAASKDPFQTEALKVYMSRFEFHDIPLDIALRKMLLEIRLPTETQQIDRVIGAFASRYEDCNQGLFSSPAYSLVLLHSDAFNKANKVKMRKEAYVKNTRLPGVASIVLEYFYDNITAQPFRRASAHPEDIDSENLDIFDSYNDRSFSGSQSLRQRRVDIYDIIAQLLFFRHTDAIPIINHREKSEAPVEFMTEPEDVVSLQDAFTVREVGFAENVIRFVSPSKHQYLLEAENAEDASIWMALMNYASAFRTSGLKIRTKTILGSDGSRTISSNATTSNERGETSDSHPDPRLAVTRAKLESLRSDMDRAWAALQAELRHVRNLGILMPVLKGTRERIEAEVDILARRVKQLRLSVARLECEHAILRDDLAA
ncbi:hypothetical protein DL93DRAFT_2163904 [Clavulina sp. PMI_390]|nr:hypothetical protein DL93DRAFT_2163904 [Clavulina sp. PMI_390]